MGKVVSLKIKKLYDDLHKIVDDQTMVLVLTMFLKGFSAGLTRDFKEKKLIEDLLDYLK